MVILSRSFCNTCLITEHDDIERVFYDGISAIRSFESGLANWAPYDFEANKHNVINTVEKVLRTIYLADEASA